MRKTAVTLFLIQGLCACAVPVGLNFFIPLADMEKYVPVDFE